MHSMVLKQNGSVWTTGNGDFGQLGDGNASYYGSLSFAMVVSSGQSV